MADTERRWPMDAQEVVSKLHEWGEDAAAAIVHELIKDSVFLRILREYGVDNWDAYDVAVDEMVYEIGG